MIMYSILTGSVPFAGCNGFTVGTKVCNGERPQLPPDIPTTYQSLITECWSPDPDLRERLGESPADQPDSDNFDAYQERLCSDPKIRSVNQDTSTSKGSVTPSIGRVKICLEMPENVEISDNAEPVRSLYCALGEVEVPPTLNAEEFAYNWNPLDGIIAHFTRKCNGNVHEKGVIVVTGSSLVTERPEIVADGLVQQHQSPKQYFTSKDEPNSWICYDFKRRRVVPTSYSIESCEYLPGDLHPKSWIFEGSNDGTEGSWEIIDRRNDNDDLNYFDVTHNFSLEAQPCRGFRFLRLRQTGKNHCGSDTLAIVSFEIFGLVFEPKMPVPRPGMFLFNDLDPLNGIIAHLTSQCGGNVHKKGVVAVTASSSKRDYGTHHVVNGKWGLGFVSKNKPNSWICLDFKKRRVVPTSYTIAFLGFSSSRPKSWVFEASNDKRLWIPLDSHQDVDDGLLPDGSSTHNYTMSSQGESFRLFRFRQTGPNVGGSNTLDLHRLEIFGTLE